MITGLIAALFGLVLSVLVLRRYRRAVQAHRHAAVAASILLGGVALLTFTASGIAGGWGELDGGHACDGYFPGPALMPEGTGYDVRPTLTPVGVQCSFTAANGSTVSVGPSSWWLSLPALAAVVTGAAAVGALVTTLSSRAAVVGKAP